jgi:hypothetical protein
MKKIVLCSIVWVGLGIAAAAQGGPQQDAGFLKPGENLVVENIPPIPSQIAEQAARYREFRSAALFGWHPVRREILIGTRFGDTQQVHKVSMPGLHDFLHLEAVKRVSCLHSFAKNRP